MAKFRLIDRDKKYAEFQFVWISALGSFNCVAKTKGNFTKLSVVFSGFYASDISSAHVLNEFEQQINLRVKSYAFYYDGNNLVFEIVHEPASDFTGFFYISNFSAFSTLFKVSSLPSTFATSTGSGDAF